MDKDIRAVEAAIEKYIPSGDHEACAAVSDPRVLETLRRFG